MKEILKTKVKTTKLHHNNQMQFSLQINYFEIATKQKQVEYNKSILVNILLAKRITFEEQLRTMKTTHYTT